MCAYCERLALLSAVVECLCGHSCDGGWGGGGYIATILLSLSVETIRTNDRTNDACSVYNGLDTGVHTGIQSVYKINL